MPSGLHEVQNLHLIGFYRLDNCWVGHCLHNIFIQDMRRERKGERLSLTDLLAKPHQRIPRYRLLLQVFLYIILIILAEILVNFGLKT